MIEKPPDPEDDSTGDEIASTLVATDPLSQTQGATDPLSQTQSATDPLSQTEVATEPTRSDRHATTLAPGTLIADTYEIQRLLGSGGMGAVWLASHRRLAGRQVAIKVLHVGAASGELLTRFRHEAEASARIGHEHIVDVLDYNTLPTGEPYIVMEHLEGEPLSARLDRGPVPVDEVLRLTRQMGLALHAAHSEGVVHRDLKPDNIFLCRSSDGPPNVKVLDFGISKVRDSDTLKTADAVVMGTPCYMSPEQAFGKSGEVDARSDVFSLGTIVYEMVCGQRAFEGDGPLTTLYQIVHADPPPVTELAPETPQVVVAAIARALAKKPDERFSDMASFVEALTGDPQETPASAPPEPSTPAPPVLSTGPSGGTPVPPPRPPSKERSIVGFVVGALVVGGVAFAGLQDRGDDPATASPSTVPEVAPSSAEPPSPSASAPSLDQAPAQPESTPEPTVGAQGGPTAPVSALSCESVTGGEAESGCPDGFAAWCGLDGSRVACCAPGLVPAGGDGACVCAPGGTTHQAAIDQGCTRRDAAADRAELLTALRGVKPLLERCYEQGLKGAKGLAGKVIFALQRLPTGRPVQAKIEVSAIPDAHVQRCLLGVMATASLPAPVDGMGAVRWPVVLGTAPAEPQPRQVEKRRSSSSGNASVKTKEPDDPEAVARSEEALSKAKAALGKGQIDDAIRFANKSMFGKPPASVRARARVIIAKAHCKGRRLADIPGSLAKLRGASKRRVRDYCKKLGVTF